MSIHNPKNCTPALALTRSVLCLLAAVICAGSLLPSFAHAAKRRAPQCQDRPGTTLAVQDGLRVFMTRQVGTSRVPGRRGSPDSSTVRLLSCRARSRKAVVLSRWHNDLDESVSVEQVSIGGGRYVVVSLVGDSGVAGDFRFLQEFDAATGKKVAEVKTSEATGPLVGNGSAFADLRVAVGGGFVYQAPEGLVASDAGGLRVLVANDGSAAPAAFDHAVAGGHAYWTLAATGMAASTMLNGHQLGSQMLP